MFAVLGKKCVLSVNKQTKHGQRPGVLQWSFHFGEGMVIAWTQEKTKTLGDTEPHHS